MKKSKSFFDLSTEEKKKIVSKAAQESNKAQKKFMESTQTNTTEGKLCRQCLNPDEKGLCTCGADRSYYGQPSPPTKDGGWECNCKIFKTYDVHHVDCNVRKQGWEYQYNLNWQDFRDTEWFYEIKEFIHQVLSRHSLTLKNEIRGNMPNKKEWPLWGQDTSPAEGNTEDKKNYNEGYNKALDDVLTLLQEVE